MFRSLITSKNIVFVTNQQMGISHKEISSWLREQNLFLYDFIDLLCDLDFFGREDLLI